MKTPTMEYSIAQNLNGNIDLYDVPFPHLSSQPANDQVNPGIGQIVSLYETIVPMYAHSSYMIQKQVEPERVANLEEPPQDLIVPQIGLGESPLDPKILSSFQHPIVTDSIIFTKEKKSAPKHKIDNSSTKQEPKDSKKRKIEHKFHILQ